MKKKTLILGISVLGLIVLAIGLLWIRKPFSKLDQIMNADKGFTFPPGFPPDPGKSGKKTLQGIDSDHDGLRDDLQRWIYARYPNDSKKRAALKQLALMYRHALLMGTSRTEMKNHLLILHKAISCLRANFPDGLDSRLEIDYTRAKALNTPKRISEYLEKDRLYDGTFLGEPLPDDMSACEN